MVCAPLRSIILSLTTVFGQKVEDFGTYFPLCVCFLEHFRLPKTVGLLMYPHIV